MMETEPPPFAPDVRDPFAPRGPWSFLAEAAPGGLARLGLGLLASWAAFFLLSNAFWAIHLKLLTGWSSLPNYWGELLTTRDLWELVENGGLKDHWAGPGASWAAGLCFLWFLWAGWRMQAAAAGHRAPFGAWCWGLVDALIIGALPLSLLAVLLTSAFATLGSTGIQGLCWLDWVGGALVRLACLSAFFLQWWLCRLGRLERMSAASRSDSAASCGWRLGGWKPLRSHLAQSFCAFWRHPVQWGTLVLGGVAVRTGLSFLGLFLAWRLGGGTPWRVLGFLFLQLAVVIFNAWLLGWFLRLAALYARQDAAVRQEIVRLQATLGKLER